MWQMRDVASVCFLNAPLLLLLLLCGCTGALQQPCLMTLGVHGGWVGISTSCLVHLAVKACEAELACEAIAALMNVPHEEDDPELEDESEDVVE